MTLKMIPLQLLMMNGRILAQVSNMVKQAVAFFNSLIKQRFQTNFAEDSNRA